MGKMKRISLKHRGFKITGVAMLEMWGGGFERAQMDSFFLPTDKLTHTNIKQSINDGKQGCRRVISARIHIYDVYVTGYTQYNRSMSLNSQQCQEACIVVNQ